MGSETRATKYSEPDYAKPVLDPKTLPYWLPSIDKYFTPATRDLLENYSHIPQEEQSKHAHDIREKAIAIRAYPCIGLGVFLVPFIARSPAYNAIVQRLKDGATMLDVGTFMGGDLRVLAYAGAPTNKIYGLDIASHWSVGFDMYRDSDKFQANFVHGDVMKPEANETLKSLKGKVDIVNISAVMHQWDLEGQMRCAENLVAFSREGALVVGYQIGNVTAQEFVAKQDGSHVWRHNPSTFREMWGQVGQTTGTKWETESRLLSWEDMGWDSADHKFMESGDMVLDFVARRTA